MECHIRNVDAGLMKRMKLEAVGRGMTLRGWILWVLEAQFPEVEKVVEQRLDDVGRRGRFGERHDGSDQKGVKKLSVEEYAKLKTSEQLQATREGKAPGR